MALQSFTITIGALTDSGNNDKNYVSGQPVYIKRKNGTLASIYRDLAGTSQIAQDGLSNVTNSKGQFTFFVEAGDYDAEYAGQITPITVVGADYFNNRVDDVTKDLQDQFNALAKNFNFTDAGFDFTTGGTIETYNQLVKDASGNSWQWQGALPHVVTAGTVPNSPDYEQRTFNEIANISGLQDELNERIKVSSIATIEAQSNAIGDKFVAKDLDNAFLIIVPSSDTGGLYYGNDAAGNKIRIDQEDKISSRYFGATFGANAIKTTRANVIAGLTNGACVLSGNTNTLKADFDGDLQGSCIAGGQENISDGYWNFIGGGKNNEIDADIVNYSTICGGNRNLINGTQAFLSFIGGGRDNVISGPTANRCTIGGGAQNIISGSQVSRATIAGGEDNQITGATAFYSTIGGGKNNRINGGAAAGGYTTIVGGLGNQISGSNTVYSFIGGGQSNSISASTGQHTVIVGGRQNVMENNAQYSVVVGGFQNLMNGQRSFIGSGFSNNIATTSGTQNAIVGGNANKMLSTTIQNSFIGGGFDNEIGVSASGTVLTGVSILGGEDNIAIASRASILGGLGLRADSYLEVVKGTYNDSANPDGMGSPSKTNYVANQIAEALGIGTDDANRANAYVWLKNGKQIRYNTPVYADNAAATLAGELVGTVYRKPTGELMEVF